MVSSEPADIKERWLRQAFSKAEIDASKWVPSRGANSNRLVIEAVYTYYARLYLNHEQLRWAAMAALVGTSFYAGFRDIDSVPGHLLSFFETAFLEMQRQIFEDQAVMHEAYLTDGLAGIRGLADAGIIDSTTVAAWQQIDSGEPRNMNAGNLSLLFREQHDIIDRFYVSMRTHTGGGAFTYAITVAGRPSIPGARSYPAVFPLSARASLPADWGITLATPLADGNIATFGNRWGLIERDTFPAFLRFLKHDTQARRLLKRCISQRVRRFLLVVRAGQLAVTLITRWRVRVSATLAPRRPSSQEVMGPTTLTGGTPVEIDLRRPPTRDQIGYVESSDFRVWASPDARAFTIKVSLPEGREFAGEAQLVTVTSLPHNAAPTRVTVKLMPGDRDHTHVMLGELSTRWGIDQPTVADWFERPRSAQLGHSYSTRVFRGRLVGYVAPEFQVEHHVSADLYIIDVIFAWDNAIVG
jgi:hypothetical protein